MDGLYHVDAFNITNDLFGGAADDSEEDAWTPPRLKLVPGLSPILDLLAEWGKGDPPGLTLEAVVRCESVLGITFTVECKESACMFDEPCEDWMLLVKLDPGHGLDHFLEGASQAVDSPNGAL